MMYFIFIISVFIGYYLASIGGWPIVIIGLISILFAIIYTGGPYPLGYNGLGDITVFIFFGLIAVPGTYYLQHLQKNLLFDIDSILIGSSIGFIAVAILCVNNIRDIISDSNVGKKTLAVRFGKKPIIFLYDAMLILPYVCIFLVFIRDNFYWDLGLCLLLFSIPIAVKLIIDIHNKEGEDLNSVLIRTISFMKTFSMLLILGIIL